MITTTQGPHSLAFRVLRLCRPSLRVDLPLRSPPIRLLRTRLPIPLPPPASLVSSSSLSPSVQFTWERLSAATLASIIARISKLGMSPLRRKFRLRSRGSCFSILLNPQWSQYDPETDTISSSNTRSRNSELTPWCALHCTLMVTAKGSICRPQFFKFMVANPLSVWTKGMIYFDQDITYLEACLENHTKSTLYMGQIEFEPSQNWSATLLKPDEHQMEIISTPREIFKAPILIRSGGIQNYLYRLQSSSQGSGPLKQEGGNVLGKLQITWQTNLGEPGRLQTQQILGTVSALNFREGNCYELLADSLHVPVNRPLLMVFFRKMLGQRYAVEWGAVQGACCNMLLHESYYLDLKSNSAAISRQDVDLRILDIPAAIRLGRSFPVHFNLMNLTDRELGPFKVLISENDFPDKRAVMVNGLHKKNLIATKLGVQKIGGITVFDTIEKKTYEHLPELEAF